MVLLLTFLLSLNQPALPALEGLASFDHPANTIGNAWVTADVLIGSDGRVQSVRAVEGLSPFRDIVVSTVQDWTFEESPTGDPAPATVVFLFRPPHIFAGEPIRRSETDLSETHPPTAVEVVDPGHPPSSVNSGATVLQLTISETGTIEEVRTVSDDSGFARGTLSAVRLWRFEPAVQDGMPVKGSVIVVVSYLRPAL